ncbi:MAG: helix-turn-helix domain-containing protein [Fimbriimonadaceae bacterium]|nr:helix-turn-helix domain-containing protein [Fimbriimonadaceae bacterium]QYK55159.1 MAG: helix-turn-helix domain-containing protein [Fimbriimonadaceae bacterium]
MTLRKFATAVGVSPTYISGVENGTIAPPTIERLQEMCRLLEQPLDRYVSLAGRWQDVARDQVGEQTEMLQLFRAVQDMTPEQVRRVTEAARQLKADEGAGSNDGS